MGRLQKHNLYIQQKYAKINSSDVVFTPDWLARRIVSLFDIQGSVLEPCKGEGAILKYLPPNTEWCELAEGKNFYNYNKKVDWIITNPPYSDFDRFLYYSLKISSNFVFLAPLSKIFKNMRNINNILKWGNFVSIHILPANKAGFPFNLPCAIYYMKKGYTGETKILSFDYENQILCKNLF